MEGGDDERRIAGVLGCGQRLRGERPETSVRLATHAGQDRAAGEDEGVRAAVADRRGGRLGLGEQPRRARCVAAQGDLVHRGAEQVDALGSIAAQQLERLHQLGDEVVVAPQAEPEPGDRRHGEDAAVPAAAGDGDRFVQRHRRVGGAPCERDGLGGDDEALGERAVVERPCLGHGRSGEAQ